MSFRTGILLLCLSVNLLVLTSLNAATINLRNGSQLEFITIPEAEGILALESGDCNNFSAIGFLKENLQTEDINALNIFWAYSKPGQAIPEALITYYGKDGLNIPYTQGWAREVVVDEAEEVFAAACDNTKFRNHEFFANTGAKDFVKLDLSPGSPGFNSQDCDRSVKVAAGCFPPVAYKYQYTLPKKIKNFKGRICVRSKGSHTYSVRCDRGSGYENCTIERLTQVAFQVRNNNGWKDLIRKNIAVGPIRVYHYTWKVKTARNFRVDIRYAAPNDTYDIIMDSF